jgi:hypothetical protein
MSEAQNLSWSLEAERTCRVRSPWWELVWHPVRGLTEVAFASGGTPATQGLVAPEPGNREAKPAQAVSGGAWKAPAILGLSQLRIGDRCWQLADLPTAEIVIQENRVTASWPARSDCPVELHARWVLEACRFWLEVSLLTPGQVADLALETVSDLGSCVAFETPDVHAAVRAALLRPQAVPDWSYLELARADEVTRVHVSPSGTVSFRLFDTALEKGVVLRARLLAAFVRRENEAWLVPQIACQFAETPPNLSR